MPGPTASMAPAPTSSSRWDMVAWGPPREPARRAYQGALPGVPPGGATVGHHQGSRREGSCREGPPQAPALCTDHPPPEPPAPRRGLRHGHIRQVWVLTLGDLPGRGHLHVQPGKAALSAAAAATQVPEHTRPHRVPAPAPPCLAVRRGRLPHFQPHVTQAPFPPGQNRDFSGRGDHQQWRCQVAAVQDRYVHSPCLVPGASVARAPKQAIC